MKTLVPLVPFVVLAALVVLLWVEVMIGTARIRTLETENVAMRMKLSAAETTLKTCRAEADGWEAASKSWEHASNRFEAVANKNHATVLGLLDIVRRWESSSRP